MIDYITIVKHLVDVFHEAQHGMKLNLEDSGQTIYG